MTYCENYEPCNKISQNAKNFPFFGDQFVLLVEKHLATRLPGFLL